jgi:nucleotide-binding universal stress UspA family protein
MAGTEANGVVVVGVDGSDDAMVALRWAEHYANSCGAMLRLVIAWEWPISYGYMALPPEYSPNADAKVTMEKAVAELSMPADRVETIVVEGSAGRELVRLGDEADLLVVGTHGHGALGSVLLGSVSSYCVHHATVPVVVVRAGRAEAA